MNLSSVVERFCENLSRRTGILTEDNIRFYWFAAMLEQDKELDHYSLEEPYTELKRKELDLLYQNDDEALCFEMKFHRHDTESSFAHTMAAGELFDDIQRLRYFAPADSTKIVRRFFLYVTDVEMQKYFNVGASSADPYRKELHAFFCGKKQSLDFGPNSPKTFLKEAYSSLPPEERAPNGLRVSGIHLLFDREVENTHCPSLKGDVCYVKLYELK